MNRVKVSCYLTCFALLLIMAIGFLTQPVAFALSNGITNLSSPLPAQDEPPVEEVILDCQYPVLSSYAGTHFLFDVQIQYKGGKSARLFELEVDVPEGFNYSIAPGYGEATEIAAMKLDPKDTYPETIKSTARPYILKVPEPGEYPIIVRAVSEDLSGTIELKAIVTAKYDLSLDTASRRLNTDATAGQDNYFSVLITNTGSADLEKLSFASPSKSRPSGWSVTFNPDEIDSLPAGGQREIEVNIIPPTKTISGDYMLTIEAEPESGYAWDNLEIRVTVLTPTIWGWVGVGIVILVVIGLVVMFMRLGRR